MCLKFIKKNQFHEKLCRTQPRTRTLSEDGVTHVKLLQLFRFQTLSNISGYKKDWRWIQPCVNQDSHKISRQSGQCIFNHPFSIWWVKKGNKFICIPLKMTLHEILMQADRIQSWRDCQLHLLLKWKKQKTGKALTDTVMKWSALLLLLSCPHGNNNQASDARALSACWGIIFTSAWISPDSVYWLTGGGHRSARGRGFWMMWSCWLHWSLTSRSPG